MEPGAQDDPREDFRQHVTDEAYRSTIELAARDPNWPPMPTLGHPDGSSPDLDGKRLEIRPRAPVPPPQHQKPSRIAPDGAATSPGSTAPANSGLPAGAGPPITFPCPACGAPLIIPRHNRNGAPGPCPNCARQIVPPHVVEPAEDREPRAETRVFRPDRSKADLGLHRRPIIRSD